MSHTSPPLKLSTAAILTLPPLLWAGNAIVGRLVHDLISPFALNFLRWAIAFVLLVPLAGWALGRSSGTWSHWRQFAVLGLLGIGCYNALLYLALKTSTPLNVTLVSSSMPVWMLALGRIVWGIPVSRRQLLGALLSMLGVAVVLSRGDPELLLHLQLVPGDLFMVLATMVWALYTWLLSKAQVPQRLRSDWAGFLLAQMVFGLVWSGLFTGGEMAMGQFHIQWGWPLGGALLFIALGPAILAYRFWGLGVQRSSPAVAGFFGNLIPLFTALLSIALLGEAPRLHHGLAFVLIVGGIMVSSRRG
ncbi:membrane protein [Delftia tsuruhatensis]|uniref:DMT family transporter n=1 Tax=Delftia tsuruhatensis TaxID=180282 RepID=UPI00064277C4|nr:DMT family transporter [Delftia tsuruhatensis]KLO59704.1 membrane protein [Delftia tsuruhatensis]